MEMPGTGDHGDAPHPPFRDPPGPDRVPPLRPSTRSASLRSKELSGSASKPTGIERAPPYLFPPLPWSPFPDRTQKLESAPRRRKLKNRGAIGLPIALALGVFTTSAISLWKLRRDWERTVKTQLSLDRCVGEAAAWVENSISATQFANLRMKAIRSALGASTALPPARAALQAALEAEGVLQILRGIAWKSHELRWLVKPCGSVTGFAEQSFPGDPWHVPLRDGLGPQPSEWKGEEDGFAFRVRTSRQRSFALLEKNGSGWTPKWRDPDRPSLD